MGVFESDFRFNRENWFELFSASLGTVVSRQVSFAKEITKGRKWDINLEKGTLTFGDTDSYKIQIIGKEVKDKGVWQWAFKDFENLDANLLEFANNVSNAGKKFGNEALREACFKLDEMYNGHNLATVACAIQKENYCYFRCNHETGPLFVAISDLPENIFEKVNIEQFANYTLDCIEQVAVNQKIFVESFLSVNEIEYEWKTKLNLVADFGEHYLILDFKPSNGFLNISQLRIADKEVEKTHNGEQEPKSKTEETKVEETKTTNDDNGWNFDE